MDLADFPYLKKLDLDMTAVTGDIRDISNNDFPALEEIALPDSVYGGSAQNIERISDAPDLVRAIHHLQKQRPKLSMLKDWYGELSEDSPDGYDIPHIEAVFPPFYICFVEVGSRIGYRWRTPGHIEWNTAVHSCEVNWLDPEPDIESPDYTKYIQDLERINLQVKLYKGFHEPPTEEEYNRLYEEHFGER